jgi:L-methionine (R)-S-oxide reductase
MDEDELTRELVASIGGGGNREHSAARVAASIRRYRGYRWVGVYEATADEIAVVAWDGPAPPTHPRFPRTKGLCGAAVASGETVVVGDVGTDARYLTTHGTTRSEIVVPIVAAGAVVGVIDVESERLHAFGDDDKRLLERCAAAIAPLWHVDGAALDM